MVELAVNIGHAATLREARQGSGPDRDGVEACERAGACQISVYLPQDRRHIQDHCVEAPPHVLQARPSLEMAARPVLNQVDIGHSLTASAQFLGPDGAPREIVDVLQRYSS